MARFQLSRSRRAVSVALAAAVVVVGALWASGTFDTPLDAHLLSVGQMPTGWAAYNVSGNGLGCLGTSLAPVGEAPTARATIGFDYGGSIPAVVERLANYPNATTAYRSIVGNLIACTTLSGQSGGQALSGTVGPLSFPRFADASEAFEANFALGGTHLGEELVIVRKGNTIMAFDEGGNPSLIPSQCQGFVEKALMKLP